MSRSIHGLLLFASLAGTGVLLTPAAGAAPPFGVILVADDSVTVSGSWARASPGAATTGAAYVILKGGAQPDQLTAVSTPVAATTEVHETINDNGVMKMRPVGPLTVAPGQTVTFAPGGLHIMMTGLKQKLTEGESFPLTLTFAHAAPVTVDVPVRGLGGRTTAGHDQMKAQ